MCKVATPYSFKHLSWPLLGKSCPWPPMPENGHWTCKFLEAPMQDPISRTTTWSDESKTRRKSKWRSNSCQSNILFPALQCRLECDSGYVSDLSPVFECTGSKYEPETPNNFFCKPAVALVISDTGDGQHHHNLDHRSSHLSHITHGHLGHRGKRNPDKGTSGQVRPALVKHS